ncbi:MAG: hypothetical protein P8N57_07370 [Flavobacteriaceae bacterium]|jgi:hypothetical protein|nr:hypothetical protein [Flavobacteriaceae bacterium]
MLKITNEVLVILGLALSVLDPITKNTKAVEGRLVSYRIFTGKKCNDYLLDVLPRT